MKIYFSTEKGAIHIKMYMCINSKEKITMFMDNVGKKNSDEHIGH